MKAKFVYESEIEDEWEEKNQKQLDIEEDKYTQLCVWPATQLGDSSSKDFTDFMLSEFGARIKFEQEVITLPGNGGEGGRHDLFFYIHSDDISKFAIPRLSSGIRWWEDVIGNNSHLIYPQEVLNKYKKTW